jgi:hypothetical protein
MQYLNETTFGQYILFPRFLINHFLDSALLLNTYTSPHRTTYLLLPPTYFSLSILLFVLAALSIGCDFRILAHRHDFFIQWRLSPF